MGKPISNDREMELLAHLYSLMDEDAKDNWSRQDAEEMVADQRRFEIDHGFIPHEYDACDFYEVIAEFIAQDAEEEN